MPICIRCNEKFPTMMKIDNKYRNLCNRKYCLTCSPFGQHNTKKLSSTLDNTKKTNSNKECYRCKTLLPIEEFYSCKGKPTSYCKLCNLKDIHKRSLLFKQECVDYKGGKCIECGYNNHICALDFHHRDPDKKDFAISSIRSRVLSDEVKKELDKCDILCAICHRIKHFKEEYLVGA